MVEALFWLVLLSLLWLAGALGAIALLLWRCFAFPAWRWQSWSALHVNFLAGSALRFDFVATLSIGLAILLTGEFLIMLRLPTLLSWLPPLPRIAPRPKSPRAAIRPGQPPAVPPPVPPPSESPFADPRPSSPQPSSVTADISADRACLSRMTALLEVWSEPAPDWISAAMRDEAAQLSPAGWSLLGDLGAAGIRLAVLLERLQLVPRHPGVEAAMTQLLDTAIAAPLAAILPERTPTLSLGAARLCELVDNFHPDDTEVADLLDRALRAMTSADWSSLDQFPQKAGRVRVLTDQWADRRGALAPVAIMAAEPTTTLSPADLIQSLLVQCGFTLARQDGAFLQAERPDLVLFLHLVDLRGKTWRLPEGPLGAWLTDHGESMAPGRALWRHLTLAALRRCDAKSLRGVVIADHGALDDEESLAARSRDRVELSWLRPGPGPLPDLPQYLKHVQSSPRSRQAAARIA